MQPPRASTTARPSQPQQEGMALIMVLIFTVLLYAMTSELVTTAQTAKLTGENDVLIARMRSHMRYVLGQTEEALLSDLAAGDQEGAEGAGGLTGGLPGGAGGLPGGAGGVPGGEEQEEPDPASIADGSQDAWFEPMGHPDGDITTYVWVEDENRKFNVLTLVSPDDEFAQESRARFVRLVDLLRDGTDFDVSRADAESLAENLTQWLRGRSRTQDLPRPPLKSDSDERFDISLPLQLDELFLLPNVTEELFYDRVWENQVLLGLESVLTVYTSLVFDPGDPDDPNAGSRPQPAAEGEGGGEGEPEPPTSAGGEEDPQPEGVGIRININTASRPVLRCLFSPAQMPDSVIEAILEWRNEPVEEDPFAAEADVPDDYLGDIQGATQEKRKMFTDVSELEEEIPEFQNIADPNVKEDFLMLVGTESDVFTVHLASMHKRNEDTRTYVLQRSRSVLVRLDEGEEGYLHPVLLHEDRRGLRVMPIDIPEESAMFDATRFADMDAFSEEERAWNPFYIDFYRPDDERQQLFNYRERLR
ncbi:MAG: type II secretion system protein GspK [Planctomycetota bacterium]|nr:type II secretion system protein GspK [Planctomycetota bacterium]MDA0933698.1 type II secretion system protein GspK [Planctomycetota bacterium]MDA1222894.1 type II secretion system protein GspK [Planctomycetota bacterium]